MNTKFYAHDLYGFQDQDLNALKAELERAFTLTMEKHDSLYHGGLYFRCTDKSGSVFRLQSNFGEIGDEWAEDEFQKHMTLLYVSSCSVVAAGTIEQVVTTPLFGGFLLRRQLS